MGGEEGVGGVGGVGGETGGLEGGRGLFCFNHSRSVSHYLTSPCTPEECVWENRGEIKKLLCVYVCACVCVCVLRMDACESQGRTDKHIIYLLIKGDKMNNILDRSHQRL